MGIHKNVSGYELFFGVKSVLATVFNEVLLVHIHE